KIFVRHPFHTRQAKMKKEDDNQKLIRDATLLQLQKSNALEQQLKAIRHNTEQTEIRLLELQREMKKARRSIRIFWLAELFGPILAIALILGGAWYAVRYAEQHYLGGESIIDKFLPRETASSP
ncbi:hypothetical protein, partial [Thiolapillus sp.]|uniref:hypothetical protein n=3 Tax=Thiolapillus sp. TaxID=2017437 RepID=UPI003AF4C379